MKKNINFLAVIQARLGSSRLPGKVLKKINNKTILEFLIDRLKLSKKINKIVIATTCNTRDKKILQILKQKKIDFYTGSEKNVLQRYYRCAKKFRAKNIIRITSDCPLLDYRIVDKVISKFEESKVDYASNSLKLTYPDGMDFEVFNFKTLEKTYLNAKSKHDLEHVCPYMRRSKKFKLLNISYKKNYSFLRLTVDHQDDLTLCNKLMTKLDDKNFFSLEDIINIYNKDKFMFNINKKHIHPKILKLNKGQVLWNRAKRSILGGNMILSKRPEVFLPNGWPTYYKKSKGCNIWDFDNKKYFDFSTMGLGTNTLGYANSEIDNYVIKNLKNGNMTSLNSKEEIILAEKLIEINKWSDIAKFTRSGGEANAVSVRIARAAGNNDKIAICGYHGWHDWYLSANLANTNRLNQHIIPGLNPSGVPRALKNSVFVFNYNDFNGLKKIYEQHKIGIIKMEVTRNIAPKNNFLKKIRKFATEKNIILIFDECTTGFRETYGGIHKLYEVEPDIAMFGKALGNGYAINAILGKKEIMEAANNSFISSTFWSEKIGFLAGIKTLEVMKKRNSWKIISDLGLIFRKKLKKCAEDNKIKIEIEGIPSLIGFNFLSVDNQKYKTFLTQEMLKRNILAYNRVYFSISHTEKMINYYFEILSEIFKLIHDFENGIKNIDEYLEYPVSFNPFVRVN